jgi:hypothetical protein
MRWPFRREWGSFNLRPQLLAGFQLNFFCGRQIYFPIPANKAGMSALFAGIGKNEFQT